MVTPEKEVVWSPKASKQLKEAYEYIRNHSFQNAMQVCSDIIAVTRKLSCHPEHYPLDKYKQNNDGTYRAFEKYGFRIAYRVLDNEIRILRVRHTSMEPLMY